MGQEPEAEMTRVNMSVLKTTARLDEYEEEALLRDGLGLFLGEYLPIRHGPALGDLVDALESPEGRRILAAVIARLEYEATDDA